MPAPKPPRPAGPTKHQLQILARERREQERTLVAEGFVEPERWDYDGGERREFVLDMDFNPPRIVREVGWRPCLKCGKPFFTEDVVRLRLCVDATSGGCRRDEDRFT
jgi:hypothetical protein